MQGRNIARRDMPSPSMKLSLPREDVHISGFGFRVLGFGFGFSVLGLGFRVSGIFQVLG